MGLLNQLEFVGQEIRDEDFVQRSRSGALPRVLLEYSLSSTNQHTCVRKLRPRREPSERIRRNGV